MASFNKVILMGNLTRDPQMSYMPNNTAVVEIGLAMNHRYKDSGGNQQEKVCFVDCTAFGKTAETINKYLAKGNPLMVEGRLELDTWQDKQGQNRSKHKVFIEKFTFVGAGKEVAGSAPAPSAPAPAPATAPEYDPPVPGGEEVPF